MAAVNPYQQYQQQSVMTASPGELTLMLFNGCVKFIKQAQLAIGEKDVEKANNRIIRAQDIISELMSTLDMDYDLSKYLMSLYDYINGELMDANIKKDASLLEGVLPLVVELRDTWAEAVKMSRSGPALNRR